MQSVQHVRTFNDITICNGMSNKTSAPAGALTVHWTYHKRLNNNFTLPVPNPMERSDVTSTLS